MFVVGAQEDAANKEDTTVALAATSTRNFLVCVPFCELLLLYFACALSVLLVCFFAANAQGAQTKVQIPDLCKEYVHNMYTHYRVSVLVTYTINPDHPVRLLTQKCV